MTRIWNNSEFLIRRLINPKTEFQWHFFTGVHLESIDHFLLSENLMRGVLEGNAFADVVISDEKTIGDVNSFEEPHRYPAGIRYVLVNGRIAVEGDQLNQAGAGQRPVGPGDARSATR